MTEYGHFDDERREYVITRPDTPLPWINYLGGRDLVGLITNTGGGYTFHRDARLRRLTRYRLDAVPPDVGARFLYVRDDQSGEAWSPGWQPMRRPLDAYACRHGLGYSSITGRRVGVTVTTTYFIPRDAAVEVWSCRVANGRDAPAAVSLVGAVEFCLWDALDDATNLQRNLSIGEVAVEDGVVFHLSEYRERRSHLAWFASSLPVVGSDSDREAFLGRARGWEAPEAVEKGRLGGSIAHGWHPIGAHQVPLLLEPGEERDVVFVLGYTENPPAAKFDPPGSTTPDLRAARATIDRFRRPAEVAAALDDLRATWTRTMTALTVRTPEPHLDRIANTWNPYQCSVTFTVSRSASMFESGIGRGIGFRDANQDVLGFVHMDPPRARERLLDLASTQLPSGGAYHQYQPLTKRGNDAVGSGFNDDPLWLVIATAAYLKETGDATILDEAAAFDSDPASAAPLYDHLTRSIGYTLERRGPHGLPLIGRADWNDCLNLNCFSTEPGQSFQTTENRPGGVAESVFIAALFVIAARELAEIARRRGDDATAAVCRREADAMAEAVRDHAWDGDWFLRAYDHVGAKVGTAADAEGRIFLEVQGMCVMAGIGLDDGRARRALASVRTHLASPHGFALVHPAFTRYRPELGEISSYPPGYKENGSVFCHANPWIVIAEARVGDGDAALRDHLATNPSARERLADLHRCEPYVFAQTIAGPEAALPGEAKNSWLTGTAAWNLVASTQWILGIRPEHDGLRVDPCLPREWDGFEAVRRFRGSTYRIAVTKPRGVAGRVTRLIVDGVPVDGAVAPLPARPGAEIDVRAEIGADPGER